LGVYFFTQIIDQFKYFWNTPDGLNEIHWRVGHEPCLDTWLKEMKINTQDSNGVDSIWMSDSPGLPAQTSDTIYMAIDSKWTTYLMWKSCRDGSMPITQVLNSWWVDASADAANENGEWALSPFPVFTTGLAGITYTNTLPTWSYYAPDEVFSPYQY
jgi:hypothetical protein